MPGPLQGVRVLDVGTAGVGPWAATFLGLLGADVLKIEAPSGDRHRFQQPLLNGLSTTYTCLNLNKRAAILDLKDPALRPSVDRLIRQADIVIDNLRPGVVDRMGVGFESAREINPRIISASSPAWGESGPFRGIPAFDTQVQAFSGFAGLNGVPGDHHEMLRYPHLDFNGSCFFTAATVLALIERERRGEGVRVTASHLGSAITVSMSRIAEYFTTGAAPDPLGGGSAATVPHQYFRCQDGQFLAVGVEKDVQWQGFCRAVRRPDLAEDPRFATNRDRVARRDELIPILNEVFASRPAHWWTVRLDNEKVPNSYLLDADTFCRHQQVIENGFLTDINPTHQGRMVVSQPPWEFSLTPAVISIGGAAPGEHTDEILSKGFGSEMAASERRDEPVERGVGTIAIAPTPPLHGIRVLDATQGYAGPFAGLLLADAGAEVIKVEPPDGDYSRQFAPAGPDGNSALFNAMNRNKTSIALDLTREADRRTYRAIAASTDILLEDWGPGVADGMGLGYEQLRTARPDLIYCVLTPFGERGPARDLPGSELVLQAWSEYWKHLGPQPGEPRRVGADVAGLGEGVIAFIGAISALYYRLRTGSGQRVGVSGLGTMLFFRTAQLAAMTNPDDWDGYCVNWISDSRRGYQTGDRPIFFTLNIATDEQYLPMLRALGMPPEVLTDPRFANRGKDALGSGKYAAEALPIWEECFRKKPFQELLDILNAHGASAIEVRRLDEILDHPQIQTLELLATDQAGNRYMRAPWAGPWERIAIKSPPAIDEHRAAIVEHLAVNA